MGKERPEFCREAGCPVFGMSGYCRLLADLRREGLSRRGLKAMRERLKNEAELITRECQQGKNDRR